MEFLLGAVVGVILTAVYILKWRIGVLKVYIPDDGDSPYLFTELDKTVGQIIKKKLVLFEVVVRNVSSQD